MIIRHNLPAITASNYLWTAETKLSKTLEKLSSGYRINRAADDAAGLSVSEKMRAQITGLNQAHINSQNGVSVVQTAEGALAESHAILQRMGELAVESMNGIYEGEDRQKLDDEYQELLEELDRISQGTNFNGIKLLDGSLERKSGQVPQELGLTANPAAELFRATREAADEAMRPRALAAYALPVPLAAAVTIPAGSDFNIAGDGVYEIADGFTGTITIAAGAKVTLTQAAPGTALHNVSLQCGAGTELTIQDLNIENSDDINAIDFTGAGNKLLVEGDNKIVSTAKPIYLGPDFSGIDRFQEVEKAVIHVGTGCELTIDGTGELTADTAGKVVFGNSANPGMSLTSRAFGQKGAVIGGDYNENVGTISIDGSTIHAYSRAGGAAIGNGNWGVSPPSAGGKITINGGTVDAFQYGLDSFYDPLTGVSTGCWTSGSAISTFHGDIEINGGTVNAAIVNGKRIDPPLAGLPNDHGIGTAIGNCGALNDRAGTIKIHGGTVTALVTGGSGAAIGASEEIIITDGAVSAAVSGNGGAAIGGRGAQGAGKIKISGGTVKAYSGGPMDGGGAAIGGGASGDNSTGLVEISGGNVTAWTAGGTGAAIGGGLKATGGTIQITGGTVTAVSGSGAGGAAIGSGQAGGDGGTISITGGNVTAAAGENANGAAIGGGSGCYCGLSGNDAPSYTAAYRPAEGADLTITGSGTIVTVTNGWIGGGRDYDSIDFAANGTISVLDATVKAPMFTAPAGTSHFGGSINAPHDPGDYATPSIPNLPEIPTIAGIEFPPKINEPEFPDDDGDSPDKPVCNTGGLILQIGTDNEEYDKLHIYIDDMSTDGLMVAGTDILTMNSAEEALDLVRYAIGRVSENRGRLGAYQNRLEHNINHLAASAENMTAAESRLRDADMAKEMAAFTMENVVTQAAQAMLAQANQKPGDVLALLK